MTIFGYNVFDDDDADEDDGQINTVSNDEKHNSMSKYMSKYSKTYFTLHEPLKTAA